MSLELPARPSYEFLRKLAKERLATLRITAPETRLAAAQTRLTSRAERRWRSP
jgi:hypothetical protein